MEKKEYWIDIYPTDDFLNPWRVQVVEARNYKVIENVFLKNDEEVNNKVNSYTQRYGRNKLMIGEHVYFTYHNKKFSFNY